MRLKWCDSHLILPISDLADSHVLVIMLSSLASPGKLDSEIGRKYRQ